MSLICPSCQHAALRIIGSVELGPGPDADERTIQRARCTNCRRRFICLFTSVRSFNPHRDDRETHVAYAAGLRAWLLAAAAFERPKRRRSATWRARIARLALAIAAGSAPSVAIKVKRHHSA